MRPIIFAVLLAASASQLQAQAFATSPCQSNSHNGNSWFNGNEHICELRSATLPLVNGRLALSGTNGSIDVIGEDRTDIRLEAEVNAQAVSRSDAEELEHKIEIVTAGEIHAKGPEFSGIFHRDNWSVNYRLRVPRHLAAHLHTVNGSVQLSDLDGAITAETTNGSMTLRDLAGDVNAHATNGSLHISLAGNQWSGGGLSAHTTNGSISVNAPAAYSAHLLGRTTNGGMHIGFPIMVQGKLGHHLDTTIGQGGPTLSLATVNGSLHFDRN